MSQYSSSKPATPSYSASQNLASLATSHATFSSQRLENDSCVLARTSANRSTQSFHSNIEYQINQDPNPEIIHKKVTEPIEYVQGIAVRYLRPPTPPAPGDIIIKQEENTLTQPAPPLVLRQYPPNRAETPEPLVIREAPPKPPTPAPGKVITISGKNLPPTPRKVILERLPRLPAKPQSVILERWLPYPQVKRRVIFQKPEGQNCAFAKPKNVIVQWEAPEVNVRPEVVYLGVIRANPADYVQRYGAELKQSNQLPDFVTEIATPDGLKLAADSQNNNNVYELVGDLEALKFVDLEQEGLAEYRQQIFGDASATRAESNNNHSRQSAATALSSFAGTTSVASINSNTQQLASQASLSSHSLASSSDN